MMHTLRRSSLAARSGDYLVVVALVMGLLVWVAGATAQVPSSVPVRAIRELNGTYTIETRATADGRQADTTNDFPGVVAFQSRAANGGVVDGILLSWRQSVNEGEVRADVPIAVVLTGAGWHVNHGAMDCHPEYIKVFGRSDPILSVPLRRDEYLHDLNPIAWRNNLTQEITARQFGPRGSYPVIYREQGNAVANSASAVERVKEYLKVLLPPVTPQHEIPLLFIQEIPDSPTAVAGTTRGTLSPLGYAITFNSLAAKALSEGESKEADTYLNFLTASSYSWESHISQPSTSSIIYQNSWFDMLVYGGPPPSLLTRPIIGIKTSAHWDTFRFDGINADKFDFERTLMHETIHALGFFLFPPLKRLMRIGCH